MPFSRLYSGKLERGQCVVVGSMPIFALKMEQVADNASREESELDLVVPMIGICHISLAVYF